MYGVNNLNKPSSTQRPTTGSTGSTSPTQQSRPLARSPSSSSLTEELSPRQPRADSPSGPRSRQSLERLATLTARTAPTEGTSASAAPATLVVDNPKGGNDKQWFPHPTLDAGWLQARESGKVDAVKREKETIEKLAGMGFPVARIIDLPPPASITSNGAGKTVFAEGGLWLARVDDVATKKPKALGHPMAGTMQTKRLMGELTKADVDLHALQRNLEALLPRVGELCHHVGEVDIAFTKDGGITLLDVAPADGGQVAAQEDGGPEMIAKGLQNLLDKVKAANEGA